MARPAAVVDEADDRLQPALAEGRQARIGPGPVGAVEAVGRDLLPQHRVAQGAQAEAGEARQVAYAAMVAAAVELGKEAVVDAVDRALEAAPHLQGWPAVFWPL